MATAPTDPSPSAGISFSTATALDVQDIVDLVEAAYRGDASRCGWTTEADLLDGQRTDAEAVLDLIRQPGSEILMAHHAGTLLACCHLERRPAATAYFGMFAVSPAGQSAGIGRAMIGEARRVALLWGCSEMVMTVIRQRGDLIAWYERLGFALTGATEPFPYGDERFGIPKRDDLEFVVLRGPVQP